MSSPITPSQDDAKLKEMFLEYLQERGYSDTAEQFRNEIQTKPGISKIEKDLLAIDIDFDIQNNIVNQVKLFSKIERSPDWFEEGYSKTRDFILQAIPEYRNELVKVLWPLYVYSYLELLSKGFPADAHIFLAAHRSEHKSLHLARIEELSRVQLETIGQSPILPFLSRKVLVRLSAISWELLRSFLEDNKLFYQLKLLNEHVFISITSRDALKPEAVVMAAQANQSQTNSVNTTKVHWGVLEVTKKLHRKHVQILRQEREHEKARLEREVKSGAASKKRSGTDSQVGNQNDVDDDVNMDGPSLGQQPAEKKLKTLDPNDTYVPSHVMRKSESQVPLPAFTDADKKEFLDDLKNKLHVSRTTCPSVCFYTFLNSYNSVNTISLSRDGRQVAAGFNDSTIKKWDLAQEKQTQRQEARILQSYEDEYHDRMQIDREPGPAEGQRKNADRKVSSTSKSVATLLEASKAEILEMPSYRKLVGHSAAITKTCFSHDGEFLLSASQDNSVRLWSNETNLNVVTYKGHNFPIWDVSFSPLGFYFATASADKTARLWSSAKIHSLRIFAGHTEDVNCVEFHPNCNYVATGSADRSVRLFDIQSGNCVRLFSNEHTDAVRAVAFSHDGKYLASAGNDKKVLLWDIDSGRLVHTFSGHTAAVTSLSFSSGSFGQITSGPIISQRDNSDPVIASSGLLASGSMDNTIKLWSASVPESSSNTTNPSSADVSPNLARTFYTKKTLVTHVSFTPRNLLLAAGLFRPSSFA